LGIVGKHKKLEHLVPQRGKGKGFVRKGKEGHGRSPYRPFWGAVLHIGKEVQRLDINMPISRSGLILAGRGQNLLFKNKTGTEKGG